MISFFFMSHSPLSLVVLGQLEAKSLRSFQQTTSQF